MFGKVACCFWDGCNKDWFIAKGDKPIINLEDNIDILGIVVPALLGFDFLLLLLMTIFLIIQAKRKEHKLLMVKDKKTTDKKKLKEEDICRYSIYK